MNHTGVGAGIHAGHMSQRVEVKEIERLYTSLMNTLSDYERQKVKEWSEEVDSSSDVKLQSHLLLRDPTTRLLHVNFHPSLIRLLREVKYLLLLKLTVTPTALEIYSHAQEYRHYISQLE